MTDRELAVSELFGVAGKVALVTGGSRGIGRMIAAAFLANGARVYIAGRDATACATAAAALSADGRCVAIPADLATDAGVAALAAAVAAREDRLDILVNNAGTAVLRPLGAFPASGWDDVLALNLKAPFMLTQALLPLLRAAASDADPARVIAIGSIGAQFADAMGGYSYCASKAGLAEMVRNLAHDLAPDRITVNVIAPGSTLTELLAQHQSVDEVTARVPLGRLGGAADLGGAALYLASRAGAWVTGATITLDGGGLIA